MVLLTVAYIEKECQRMQLMKSLTKGLRKNCLRKITHLYMNDKFIDAIGNISTCENLRVIFLQNNCISRIENINFAVNLTHLYLQHNNLMKLENLDELQNLTHLYVGYNRINVVEGLENCEKLCELYIENQLLPNGESLIFHPKSTATLSMRLRKLNITGNHLTSLRPLRNFVNLQILDAQWNAISDIQDLTETIISLRSLSELYLQNNPVTSQYRYRENLIANSSDSLVNLDDKIVSDISRRFLKNFKEKKQQLARNNVMKNTLSDDITASLKLPPAFERSVSRAILQQPPKLTVSMSCTIGETKPQFYPPWKSATSIIGKKGNNYTPRPLWRAVAGGGKHQQNIHQATGISVNLKQSSSIG